MQTENKFNGIIAVNKPKAFTSFDVIAVMRGIIKQKKIGHTGTLDPMATGVLPIMLGKATKILPLLGDTSKEYIAEFKLGITTNTQDITGKIISEKSSSIAEKEITQKLEAFKGNIKQIPPMFSAVKINGKRLYKLARQAIEVERQPRNITIYDIKLLSFNQKEQQGSLLISCSQGTYIRTICHDLGESLGCGGILTALQRTKACSFTINNCLTLDEIKQYATDGTLKDKIYNMDVMFQKYDKVNLSKVQAIKFQNGSNLSLINLKKPIQSKTDNILRLYYNDLFLGLGLIDSSKEELKVYKNLSTISLTTGQAI